MVPVGTLLHHGDRELVMGGRSSSKGSSGSSYKAVPMATQAQANKQLDGLLGKQLGFVGNVLSTLIPRGEEWMEGRPGIQNFMKKTNQLKDGIESIADKPRSLFDELLGIDRTEGDAKKDTKQATNEYGLTPEQLAMMQKYSDPGSGYNYSGQYNINDDMRNRFNR